ncbi:MAG: hypothetical protein V4808_16895 [Pseudomonadota bacterium]
MLLALTLAALAPQTAAAAERGCIIEGLVPDQRVNLAERFILGDMPAVEEIARQSAAKCAAQWKWSEDVRGWQILHSATYSAMIALESRLPKMLSSTRLEALFGKLAEPDQFGLTNHGAARLEPEAYTAMLRRVAALLTAEKVAAADLENAGNWFVAYAQFMESDAHLKALAKPG